MTSKNSSPVTVLWKDDLEFEGTFDDQFGEDGDHDCEDDFDDDFDAEADDDLEDDFEEDFEPDFDDDVDDLDGSSREELGEGFDEDEDPGEEAEIVATFTHAQLMGGFAQAAVEACRDGVPISVRSGQMLYSRQGGALHVDAFQQRLEALQAKREELGRELDNAHFMIRTSADQEQRASWAATERNLLGQRKELERRIAHVEELRDRPHLAPQRLFTVAQALRQALSGLAVPDKRLSQSQYQALRMAMPVFRVDQDAHGQWVGTAMLRASLVKGGLVEIGPFTWRVGGGGRGRARVVSRTAGPRRAEDRSTVRTRLRACGALTIEAEQAILNATFDELPYVVLHGATGAPLPDWVGPQWRTVEFVSWVTRVYTQDPFPWADQGRYVTQSPHRQLLAHLCRRDDVVPVSTVKELVPVPDLNAFLRLKRPWAGGSGVTWPASVGWVGETTGKGAHRDRGFVGVRCVCGQVAHIVARVPEVPRALLCECGRMPDAADYGMPVDLRFPDAYAQALLVPLEACIEDIWTGLSTREVKPSAIMRAVLAHMERLEAGCTVWDIEQASGLQRFKVRGVIERLYAFEFLSKDDTGSGVYRAAHPELLARLAAGTPTRPPLQQPRRQP